MQGSVDVPAPARQPRRIRHRRLAFGVVLSLMLGGAGAQQMPVPPMHAPGMDGTMAMIDAGDFAGARRVIDAALARPGLAPDERAAWEFQDERMRRMRLDFTLDRAQVLERIRRQIPDLGEAEFDRWDEAGWVEHLDIDGQRRWFNRAPSNLFLLNPQAAARRAPPVHASADGPMESLNPYHVAVVEDAKATGADSVQPRRVRIDYTLTVKADTVPAGETLRVWLPYPRAIPGQQDHIRLLQAAPGRAQLAPESALQRTAYLEGKAVAGRPTTFEVSYALTTHGRWFDIDADKVTPAAADDPTLAPYLGEEGPHIRFSPALHAYSKAIVGDETNPYRIAQKLFAAVDAIPWGGAREYSTIGNIGDYAFRAGHADCGQQTLLLITLLRMNGIPARWQSGWVFSESGYDTMHDWGQLYLAPYGWVPMDVTTGQLASDDPDLRWFYLGGLDAYRVTFNDAISQPFVPAKRFVRSETVDNQRGEVEWRGGNLYFDQWTYDFRWQMLPAGGAQ